ncbi:hypothetical protein [Nonomuraea sp. NPDC049028]|uniref:hypothetical protein n=1 Tax=Nonomuraea sp. NPDC049028 TaxID=3364348 RepID=UPI0037227EE1
MNRSVEVRISARWPETILCPAVRPAVIKAWKAPPVHPVENTTDLVRWMIRVRDDLPEAAYTLKRAPHNWH